MDSAIVVGVFGRKLPMQAQSTAKQLHISLHSTTRLKVE